MQVALARRVDHASEDLLGLRAVPGAIPATDFARDDRRPERVFGAPVRRVNRRHEQETPDRVELAIEVTAVARDRRHACGSRQGFTETRDEPAARDGKAAIGDGAGAVAIADGQGGVEHPLDFGEDPTARMIAAELAAAPQEVRETRLMGGPGKPPIGCPPIAHEYAPKVPAEHRCRFWKSTTRLDAIDRRPVRGVRPQPRQEAGDLPPGFVGTDDRTAANLRTERVVGRPRLPRRAMDRVDQPAPRDGHAVQLIEEPGDLAEREAQLFVEHDDERDELGPELRRGRAQRVGGLQRMPTLDAAAARLAAADMDGELPHDDAADRNLFLILRGLADRLDRPTTLRTSDWQRRVVAFVNPPRLATARLRSIRPSRLATRPLRMALQWLRKRCRLSKSGATSGLELTLQPINSTLQPLFLPLQLLPFLSQRVALTLDPFGALPPATLIRRLAVRRLRHAAVMPEFSTQYNRYPLNSYTGSSPDRLDISCVGGVAGATSNSRRPTPDEVDLRHGAALGFATNPTIRRPWLVRDLELAAGGRFSILVPPSP